MTLVAQGTMNKSNFGDLLEPGLRKIYFDELAQLPTMYDNIFHVFGSSKQSESDSGVSGLGQLVQADDAEALTYESLQQLYDVSYVHKTYKKGIQIERELYDDDCSGHYLTKCEDEPKASITYKVKIWMMKQCVNSQERLLKMVLNWVGLLVHWKAREAFN